MHGTRNHDRCNGPQTLHDFFCVGETSIRGWQRRAERAEVGIENVIGAILDDILTPKLLLQDDQ
jgi:hypothetical protein